MTNTNTEIPTCALCGGTILYEVKMEAEDGESVENGYRLTVAAVCEDCDTVARPSEAMSRQMAALTAYFVPEGACVSPVRSTGQ